MTGKIGKFLSHEKILHYTAYRFLEVQIFGSVAILLLHRLCKIVIVYITYVFFMIQRAAGDQDDEALALTRKLVEENSDLSTMWNYRREILGSRLSSV